MAGINLGRVVLGGLLAGLVMNIGETILNVPILGSDWEAAMESLNRSSEMGTGTLIFYIVWGFMVGIAMVWLYAAIRPRFGTGAKTAVIAGLTVWVFLWLLGFGSMAIPGGLFPTKIIVTTLMWGIFEVPIAAVAGAWLYQEGSSAPAAAASEF